MMWRKNPIAGPAASGGHPVHPGPGAAGPLAGAIIGDAEVKKRRKRKRLRTGAGVLVTVLLVVALAINAGTIAGVLFPQHSKYHILMVDYNAVASDITLLTASGPRLTGTLPELRGAEYIASQFEGAGLANVRILEYNITLYEVTKATLAIAPYIRGAIPNPFSADTEFVHKTDFMVGAYSGSRGWNRWTDDLVMEDCGNGSDPAAFDSARGRAVIATNDGGITNTQLFLAAWQAGAAALVIHNVAADSQVGCPAICYSHNAVDEKGHTIPLPDNYTAGAGPNIPSIMVSKKTGELLKDALGLGNRLRMDIQETVEKRPCRVVTGEKKGAIFPDKLIIVGAHHDTVYASPGAVDNTAGTASVIGIAREIGKLKPAKTIRFATFGGEEEGVLGAYEYYKDQSDKLKGHLEAMLNMDMSNIYTDRAHTLPISVSTSKWIKPILEIKSEAVRKYPDLSGYEVAVGQSNLTSSSDMAPFAIEGYKVASCWGSGCWEYHTPKDTTKYITPESFKVVGAVYGSFALHLAGGTA